MDTSPCPPRAVEDGAGRAPGVTMKCERAAGSVCAAMNHGCWIGDEREAEVEHHLQAVRVGRRDEARERRIAAVRRGDVR